MIGGLVSFALEHWEWLAPLAGAPLAAIPFAGPVLVFLKTNWKWAVPSAVTAAAVVYAGAQRINYLDCKADRAQSIAAAEKAVRDHLEADRRHGEQLVGEYALEIAQLQEKYENAQIRLNRAASVAACANTPAARAFDDGVSALDREAGRNDTPPAGRVGAAVPGPANPASRLR